MTDTLKPAELDLEALKPCPFCGGGDVVPSQVTSCGGWGVLCRGCHAYQDTRAEDITEALAAWNRRAPDPRIEALEAERDEARAGLAYVLDRAVYGDSYGVYGSDFQCCHFCQGGGAPGVAMEHDADCPVSRYPRAVADWFEEMEAERQDREAAEAQRDRMREALEPFAAAAGDIRPDDADTMRPAIVQAVHFRRAAKVVSALSQGSGSIPRQGGFRPQP
jgi:Lar family restriction alleviation protein